MLAWPPSRHGRSPLRCPIALSAEDRNTRRTILAAALLSASTLVAAQTVVPGDPHADDPAGIVHALPILLILAGAIPAAAQSPRDPGEMASGTDARAIVADIAAQMRDGRGFLYHPLVKDGTTVAALGYWNEAGRPAVHPDKAEYALVIDGADTLVSGGTMVEAKETHPGLVEGSRIAGGTSWTLPPGDVILIPASVSHWFGITGGKLVLLGMKLLATAADRPLPD